MTDVYDNPVPRIIAPEDRSRSSSLQRLKLPLTLHSATMPSNTRSGDPRRVADLHAAVPLLPVGPPRPDGAGEFGQLPSGGGRVRTLTKWVRNHVEYHYGTTDAKTSAFDTATERIGVCRDLRIWSSPSAGLGIPARYASCYAPGLEPPDFHSVAQVFLSGAWHNVDATTEAVRPALIPSRSVGTLPMSR